MELVRKKSGFYLGLWAFLIPFFAMTAYVPQLSVGIIFALLGLVVTFYFFFEANHKMIYFIFVVSIVQNALVILAMGLGGVNQAYLFQFYKEIFLIGIVLYMLLFRNKLLSSMTSVDAYSLAFIMYVVIVSSLLGDANMFTKVASLRQVIVPFLFYLLGRHITISEPNMKKLIVKLHGFALLIVGFGIFESYVHPTFWEEVGIYNFFLEKRGQEALTMVNGIPSNFYTSDFVKYTGMMLRRMASFVANPPVLAHILGYLAVLTLFTRKNTGKGIFSLLLIIVGVMLTLGKGGIITIIIGFGCYIVLILRRPLLGYMLACLGLFGAIAYMAKVIRDGLSAVDHIFGFTNSLVKGFSHPLGGGLGTVGNLSEVYNESSSVSEGGGAESFMGLVVGQFGVFGFVTFIMFFVMIMVKLLKYIKGFEVDHFQHRLGAALFSIILAIFVTSFLTESAISYTSAGIPLLLASVLINNSKSIEAVGEKVTSKKRKIKFTLS